MHWTENVVQVYSNVGDSKGLFAILNQVILIEIYIPSTKRYYFCSCILFLWNFLTIDYYRCKHSYSKATNSNPVFCITYLLLFPSYLSYPPIPHLRIHQPNTLSLSFSYPTFLLEALFQPFRRSPPVLSVPLLSFFGLRH